MATLPQFINNIRRRANAVLTNAPKATARAAQAAIDSLAVTTPKLTTRARSNWVASIGSPDLSPRGFRSVAAVKAEARSKLKALEADQDGAGIAGRRLLGGGEQPGVAQARAQQREQQGRAAWGRLLGIANVSTHGPVDLACGVQRYVVPRSGKGTALKASRWLPQV